MSNSQRKAAMIGLGLMGSGMARQLLAKDFDLAVYNRSPAKAAPFGERGARIAASPAEAAADADFVVTMVADDDASRAVWLGENGALAAMKPGAVAIESSTLTVGWMKALGAAAAERGMTFLDAPVTGSRAQADAGELRFLVGGDAEAIARARPALDAMGTDVVSLGPVGSGALLKLINNFLCGVQAATLAEAIAMAERSGLDAAQAAAALVNGAPGSPLVKGVSQRMLERDYTPHFMVPLMAKDLAYAVDAFQQEGIELGTAKAARERFLKAAEEGLVDTDIASIIEPLRR